MSMVALGVGGLPASVRPALDRLASPEPAPAEAWRELAGYLTSPPALAATLAVGTPHVARLHLELLKWGVHKGAEPAA